MISAIPISLALAALSPLAAGHAAIWTPAMAGFNVTAQTYSYDNRPVVPLYNMPFSQWWMHGHLDHMPHPDDVVEFPAGGSTELQISCDKGYTKYYASSEGGDIRDFSSDLACPGQPTTIIHANNFNDSAGCALGIAYKSDLRDVQPEDFVIFSVIFRCPWYLNNTFYVPENMPPCPNGKCSCAFFWIHNPDSGSEQMYMNGFQCNITGNVGTQPLGKPGLPRQCGADAASGHAANPANCTVGPMNPFYWDQTEGNNMFEGIYDAPTYSPRYGFVDGAQPNLFQDATIGVTQAPSPNQPAPTSDVPAPASSSASPAPANANVPPPPAASSDASQASSSPAPADNNTPPPPPPAPASPSEVPSQTPVSATAAPPPPPSPVASTSVAAPADTPAAASPAGDLAASSAAPVSSAAPASTQKCRPRNQKKKRSAVQRHLKKRLTADGLSH